MDDALSALARLARMRPDHVAFSELGGSSISYARLARTVRALVADYRSLPEVVGLSAPSGIAWVASSLAALAADRTLVPLPEFFSAAQLAHIIGDAGIGHILATSATRGQVAGFGPPVTEIALPDADEAFNAAAVFDGDGRLVIYTSGSTGRPKGVRIGARQLAHSARSIGAATGAGPGDVYLSVLPLSLLLEQVCAVHVALRTGARVVFGGADARDDLVGLVEWVRPSLMVLVPQLLSAWTAALQRSGSIAPTSLRLVAVGGAPVPVALAEAAWRVGIPVHEGYGLSECCAVVALNRPGDRRAGTVGRPLDDVLVTVEDGEIVVRGPTVMDGYLNDGGVSADGAWRTGDLGAFYPDGRLVVHGRKDSMVVTAGGRNIVPEWIEAMVTADPRFAHCILVDAGEGGLTAILVAGDGCAGDLRAMPDDELARHVAGLAAAAPAYARPERCIVVSEDDLRRRGLLTDGGRPRRRPVQAAFAGGATRPRPSPPNEPRARP